MLLKKTVEMKKFSPCNDREISRGVKKRQGRAPDEISERYSFKYVLGVSIDLFAPFFTEALSSESKHTGVKRA